MRKYLLIASVAAMAVTAPAQAERGGRKGEQAQAQQQSDEGGRGERRANRQQQAQQPRAERQQAPERRQMRQEDFSNRRAAQQQGQVERRARMEQGQSERRARMEQAQSERRNGQRNEEFSDRRAAQQQQAQSERRARSEQAQSERRSRMEQAQSERRAQAQQADSNRRQRMEQAQADRRSRSDAQSDRRSRNEQARFDRRAQNQQVESDRRSRFEQARSDRRSRFQQADSDQRAAFQQVESDRRTRFADERRAFAGDDNQWRQRLWDRRAERQNGLAELRERRLARWTRDNDDRRDRYDTFRVGQRVDRDWWYDDYVPYRYRANYYDDDDRYYYRYDGDYLYRLSQNNVVLSLFPILGGAYSVGRPMPYYYDSYYNVPRGYGSLYYDTPNSYYRYGDGAIYGIDPTTQLITGIVALLTGQNFGVGQMLPMGYDVYNVPQAYRSSYYDTPDMWYRYDDGYIYGVDPRTRLIQTSYPVYGGYMVGNEWPEYAGYDYDVPDYYDDLYYDAPGYDYRYASGGIYQVDPKTQLIAALAALVTGQNFNVGQRLPVGYDVYNVPFAYRDDYYDNDDNWYRYADGRILQVDPGTRVIRRVILV